MSVKSRRELMESLSERYRSGSLPTKSQLRLSCEALHNRRNFLFVGHEEAGENLAGLYSLVARCEANGVEPISYLTDVLSRVGSHPAARLEELLPHRWHPPD